MKQLAKRIALVAAVAAALWAATAWPRLNDVETGRTPEYPDLKVRDYGAGVDAVVKGVEGVIRRLPRWKIVGSGKGPGGAEIKAVHQLPLVPLADDVTIRVRREKGRTLVSVRSRSRSVPWDLGQNARNVRELLDALDHEVF